MLALHIASAFMSIYLYQQGYGVIFIAIFWACWYAFKIVITLPATALAAWVGVKHGILISNFMYIPAMVCFALVPEFGPWLLIPTAILQATSTALYNVSYLIDFSRVKSVEHAGKEIAYMNIIERATTGLSPLFGGLLAFIFGPQSIIIISGLLFAVAAAPLLKTPEQEPPRQKLSFRGIPWYLIRPTVVSQMAIGFDIFTSGTVWTLFTTIFILGITTSNEIYIASGALLSVVFFAALISSYIFGKLIDGSKGRDLMITAAFVNSLTHFIRPFTATPVSIAGLNVANEAATTAYTMAYSRAVFDNADISGKRTVYLGIVDMLSTSGAFIGALLLVVLVSLLGEQTALQSFFVVAGLVVLLIATARFPLYKK
jgi:MFS family permease